MSRKLQSHGNPSLEDLPEELILDMLSRLPGTTLIYCKCVCKKLQNLVSEIRLPKCLMIYQFENTIKGFQPRDLKLVEIKELNQNNLLHDPFMGIDMTKLIPGSCINIEGSVDGLVCFTDECERTYICNPMTREYMIIPEQKIDETCWRKYGFGVSLAGEYKVIRIFMICDPIKIEVYTLGTYQWRNLDVPRELNLPRLFGHGLYFNGHFYWISDNQLLSFNMDKEKFQLVPFSPPPPPPQKGYTWLSNSCLGLLKGCLCCVYKSDNEFIFWVMTKERKMKKYCHKELDIAKSTFKDMYLESVIEGSIDQTILIVQNIKNRHMIAYCLETNKFEAFTLSETDFKIYNYRPSCHKLRNLELSARIHVF